MEKQTNNINNKEVMISIRELYKTFGDNHVLQGINLEVYKGGLKTSLKNRTTN